MISSCPVCQKIPGQYGRVALSGDQHFLIMKCPDCGLEFTDPMPSEIDLNKFYSDYIDIRANKRIVELNSEINLLFLKNLGYEGGDQVLDFGSGSGAFVRTVGNNCFGYEPMAPFSVELSASCYRSLSDIPFRSFKFVTLWGVLEHLTDPTEVVRNISELMLTEGFLVLTTVDAESNIPFYYKPIEHLTYWTRNSLEKLGLSCGLELKTVEPYTMIQKTEVYLDRVLSRTPVQLRQQILRQLFNLPAVVEIPTNELIAVFQKIGNI